MIYTTELVIWNEYIMDENGSAVLHSSLLYNFKEQLLRFKCLVLRNKCSKCYVLRNKCACIILHKRFERGNGLISLKAQENFDWILHPCRASTSF